MSVRDKVIRGCKWLLGTGNSVHVWKDNWLPGQDGFIRSRPSAEIPTNISVAELMQLDGSQWNRDLIFRNFEGTEAKKLLVFLSVL